MNDVGQIIGGTTVWSAKTGVVGLSLCSPAIFGCFQSAVANGINNRGQIVGSGRDPGSSERPIVWDGPNKLGLLSEFGVSSVSVLAISNSGLAVGQLPAGHTSHATSWDLNGNFKELPPVGDSIYGPAGIARDVNNAGVIVGASSTANSLYNHATLWRGGSPQDIGVLAGDATSQAYGINNNDVVVGDSDALGFVHAFLWTAASGLVSLDPAADQVSSARAVNDANWVVGAFGPKLRDSRGDRAALWRPNGSLEDLNSLSDLSHSSFLQLTGAIDINALGEIIGSGIGRDGQIHAFLLTPTPEAQTWGCMLVGLVSLAFLRGRWSRA